MRKKYLFLAPIILSVMFTGSIFANEESKHKLTEELVSIMKVNVMVNQMFEQAEQIQMDQVKKNIMSVEGDTASAQVLQEKITALLKKELDWEVIKNDYIAIYEEAFTEDEIQGLIDFSKSSLGQKFLEKNPEIVSKSLEIKQKHKTSVMSEVQKLIKEWMVEQKRIQRDSTNIKEIDK